MSYTSASLLWWQVGSLDGRIKLLGTSCVEMTLTAPEQSPTKSLHVLPNTGCILRLDTLGDVELWSIPNSSRVQCLRPPRGDAVTVLRPLLHDPYVLTGCRSGSLRVFGLVNALQEPSSPASPVSGLQWLPYVALPEDLGAPDDTEVLALDVANDAQGHLRVAMLHAGHAVTVWALHTRQVYGAGAACLVCCCHACDNGKRLTLRPHVRS
jgi:WD40 repeat protein